MSRLQWLVVAAVWTGLAAIQSQPTLGDTASSGQSGSSIPALTIERQLLEARYKQVTDQINEQAKSVQELEKFNGGVEQVRSEIDELKSIAKDMGTTLQKRKIELDAAPRVSIVQQATPPEPVSTARPYVAAGIGACLGLLLVVIGAVAVAMRRKPAPNLGLGTIGEATPIRSTRWIGWTITACSALIVAAGLGTLGWFLFPVKYESAAYVRVSIVDPAVWEQHSGVDFESYKRSMIETIKSPTILGKAVEDKSIQDFPLYRTNSVDPVNWLADALDVKGGNSEILRVSLRNDDPQGLKEIVDAVIGAFKDEVIDRARTEKLNGVDDLEKKFKSYQAQIFDKQRALYNLSQQIGTSDSPAARVQYRMQVDALDTLLRQRTDLQRQISDVELKLELAKALQDLEKKTGAPAAHVDTPIAADPQAQR